MSEHFDELSALYALGALDDAERRKVEAHARDCDPCARALAAAEKEVAALTAAQPIVSPPAELDRRVNALFARPRPNRYAPLLAAAAALVLGLLPSAYFWEQDRALHVAMQAQAEAMHRIAMMPHREATFTPMSVGTAARVLYAVDGSWYVVVVRGITREVQVAWMHDGERTILGDAVPHGDVAMLYLPNSHRMDQLALLSDENVVAKAQLAY